MILTAKKILKNYFHYFLFFYSHLGYRVIITLLLSILVGILDGFGLTMFLPLLQLINDNSSTTFDDKSGVLLFTYNAFQHFNIDISLITVLILILIFFSLKGFFKFLEGYFRTVYQQFFIKNIRNKNTRYLTSFSYKAFLESDPGRIQNTFTGEVDRVNTSYRSYFMTLQAFILVLVYMVFAFFANPQFAILISIGGILTNVIFKSLFSKTKKLSKELTSRTHHFQSLVIQKVLNFKYLKATGLINNYSFKLNKDVDEIERTQRNMGIYSAVLIGLREPLTILIVAIVILMQVYVLSGSLGIIILSLLFFYRALNFLMLLQNQWNIFLGVSGSLNNMTEFSDYLAVNQEQYGKKEFHEFKSEYEIDNITIDYNGVKALNNVSLVLKKNTTIAIVGESGSGKTTLLNVLVGLIKPKEGNIIIDGVPINSYDIRSIQNRIGYITQEPVIFNDSIFNNITFWSDKTENNLIRFDDALKMASIYDFVYNQSDKEDTILGNNGISLSGGQRQRMAIARELFKEIDFLMMDEATSALDSSTETEIQRNIDLIKGKYTIIIIAHRLSTIKNADKIYFLKNGSINANGKFTELVKTSQEFKQMVALQEF